MQLPKNENKINKHAIKRIFIETKKNKNKKKTTTAVFER